ncbi:MAG: discoidin domain-containing protein [Vicinamibacteria bacterium]|nr:discoidin domain-containing protein [Vicinamibacteria bacterium]
MPERVRTPLALALFTALSLVAVYPLSCRPGSSVSYEGDALLNTFILAHSAPALFTDPARFWKLPAFVPYERALAFSEHLLFPSLLSWPIRAASGNPLLAHNVLVIAFLVLSAFCMYLLVKRVTRDAAAAVAAGALFGFNTFIVNEAPRLQIQAQWLFPLGLLVLVRHVATPHWLTGFAFAGIVLACGLSNNYFQVYMPLLFGFALPWLIAGAPRRAWMRTLALLAAPLVPVLAIFIYMARTYLDVAQRFGFVRDLPAGIPLNHYLATRPENWIYGATVEGVRLQIQAAHFVGFLALLLALVACVAALRGHASRRWAFMSATGFAFFVLLSAGREVVVCGRQLAPGPYRLLYGLPGFGLMRIPERLGILAALWLAILVGLGVHVVLRRMRGWRRVVTGVVLAACVFMEHLSIPAPNVPMPSGRDIPDVYKWLARFPAGRVAEIPFYGPWLNRLDSLPMYFATGAPRAIVNGYTGFYPPAYAFLRHKLSSEPGAFVLDIIERLDLDHIVVRPLLWQPENRARWRAFLDACPDRLRRVQSFPSAPFRDGPAWEYGGETVYRVLRHGRRAPSYAPARSAIQPRNDWTITASHGACVRSLLDGDPATQWRTGTESTAGQFIELRFAADLEIRGVRMQLVYPHTGYPGALDVSIRRPEGKWRLVRFDQDVADRELLDVLLTRGADVWYSIDFPSTVVANGVRLVVRRADPTLDEWRIAEIGIYR